MKMLRAANGKPVEGKMEATAEKRGQGSGREEGGKEGSRDRPPPASSTHSRLSPVPERPPGSASARPTDVCSVPGLQISGSLEAHAHSLALRSIQVCPSLRHTGCVCASCDCVRRRGGQAGGRTDDSSVDPKAAAEAAAGEAGLHPAGTAGNRF